MILQLIIYQYVKKRVLPGVGMKKNRETDKQGIYLRSR